LSPCSHTVFDGAALVISKQGKAHNAKKQNKTKTSKKKSLVLLLVDTHSLFSFISSLLSLLASFVALSSGWVDREGSTGKGGEREMRWSAELREAINRN
jgi:hypothetical protein